MSGSALTESLVPRQSLGTSKLAACNYARAAVIAGGVFNVW